MTLDIRLKTVHPSFAADRRDCKGYHCPLQQCGAVVTAAVAAAA